jgi:hypothetical protein
MVAIREVDSRLAASPASKKLCGPSVDKKTEQCSQKNFEPFVPSCEKKEQSPETRFQLF